MAQSIPHLNSLSNDEFFDVLSKIGTLPLYEKFDGQNARLIVNEKGVTVSREHKGGESYTSKNKIPLSTSTYFMSPVYDFGMKLYEQNIYGEFNIEILIGSRPNTIEYVMNDNYVTLVVLNDDSIETMSFQSKMYLPYSDGMTTSYKMTDMAVRTMTPTELIIPDDFINSEIEMCLQMPKDDAYNWISSKLCSISRLGETAEGYVLSLDDQLYKIVDKNRFTDLNKTVHHTYKAILEKPKSQNTKVGHSLYGRFLVELGNVFGSGLSFTHVGRKSSFQISNDVDISKSLDICNAYLKEYIDHLSDFNNISNGICHTDLTLKNKCWLTYSQLKANIRQIESILATMDSNVAKFNNIRTYVYGKSKHEAATEA